MTNEELRRMRKAKRMTQADLAAAIGYSRKTIVSWENAVHPILDDVAVKVTAICVGPPPAPKASVALIRETVESYRHMRKQPNNMTHAAIAAYWGSRQFVPCSEAVALILAEYPDINNGATK